MCSSFLFIYFLYLEDVVMQLVALLLLHVTESLMIDLDPRLVLQLLDLLHVSLLLLDGLQAVVLARRKADYGASLGPF